MSISIQPLTSSCPAAFDPSFFLEVQERASQIFIDVKECLFPPEQHEVPARVFVDLGAVWRDPGQLIEGGIWGAWWVVGVGFLSGSLKELYTRITTESSEDIRFQKIIFAAKSVFVDIISLASSTLYAARWAEGAKIVALGIYLPLMRYLCYGTSLLISMVETGFDMHQFCIEAKGLLYEQSPIASNNHLKQVCHLSMKLISNVSMTAWAILGIASLAGVVVHSALMPLLLTAGCVVGVAAIYYKIQIGSDGLDN